MQRVISLIVMQYFAHLSRLQNEDSSEVNST